MMADKVTGENKTPHSPPSAEGSPSPSAPATAPAEPTASRGAKGSGQGASQGPGQSTGASGKSGSGTGSKQKAKPAPPAVPECELPGVFAFKQAMTSVYNDQGHVVPVTVLSFVPQVVAGVKNARDGAKAAVQVAFGLRKRAQRATRSELGQLKAAGLKNGARFVREVPVAELKDVQLGARVSIGSLKAGDRLSVSARSKGRGFAGAVKRWGFGGGPASHGAGFGRAPGSVGNCQEPGRIMPGRKMPGHFGFRACTLRNVEVVRVLKEQGAILVKGSVPGARNTMVKLLKI